MKLYFQMFSARNTPLDEALQIVADAGYQGVELYNDNMRDLQALKAPLQSNNLSVPSMHISLQSLREDLPACVELAKKLSCNHVVCPYLEPQDRPASVSGWQTLANELSNISTRLKDAGCTFAWHNHDFEFLPLDDGSFPIDHLLSTAANLSLEIDVAWIVRAQQNPAIWIEKYQDRLSAVHVKDIAPAGRCQDEDGWADLGEGIVPWSELLPKLLASPASLYIMEHDNPSDLKRFATRSFAAAVKLNMGEGA